MALGLLGFAWPARAVNDPGLPQQWNMHVVGAETAWKTGVGSGTTIAVIDSGVDFDHEDLTGRVLAGRNFVTPDRSAQDDHGHGTHVAGIAAAAADNAKGVVGIAPSARILPVKVFDADGRTTNTAIYDGIRWAADNGAQVINLSLSASVRAELEGRELSVPRSAVDLSAAVRYAWNKGVICVLASGNDGFVASAFANEPGVVVTATDKNDRLAPYANKVGAAMWGMAAPGGAGGDPNEDDILSTYWVKSAASQYAWAAGTSMAAPHVAGAAAVLRGLGLSRDQTVDRLRTTAKDLGDPGRDDAYGDGRVDVAKAVAGLAPAPTTLTAKGSSVTTTTARTGGGTGSGSGGTGGSRATVVSPRAPSVGMAPTTRGAQAPAAIGEPTPMDTDIDGDGDGDDVKIEELGEPRASTSGDDDSVFPAGAVAAAALGAVALAAARARRPRV